MEALLQETEPFLKLVELDKKSYSQLIKIMLRHDSLYYTYDNPILDDTEYDYLYTLLQKYESKPGVKPIKSSPTQKITGNIKGNLRKIKHIYPMLSLDKTKTLEGVSDFLANWNLNKNDKYYTDSFLIQHKEDGITVVLYFNHPKVNNGMFTAVTRGMGSAGEDITESFINIPGIEKAIKNIGDQTVVLRGEAIISDKNFEEANSDGKFMNSRNLVAASLRTKDINIASDRKVQFLSYNIENAADLNISTELEQLSWLDKMGFATSTGYETFSNTEEGKKELLAYIQNYSDEARENVGHAIDGLVIKPNVISNKDKIGYTEHHPKYQLAYKFKSSETRTKIKDVVWQVGKTGVLTPVAIVEPVYLLGVRIERATLANLNNIKERNLMINDYVIIKRSNDVIPQIIKSLPELRDGTEVSIEAPENSHPVDGLIYINEMTMDQQLEQWREFVSKRAMNIQGLSKSRIKTLIENKVIDINDFSSIYHMDYEKFINTDGFDRPLWDSINLSLEKSKNVGLVRVLTGLNIKGIGHNFGSLLIKSFTKWQDVVSSIENIGKQETAFLIQKKAGSGIGDKTIEVIVNDLFSDETFEKINALIDSGVVFEENVVEQTLAGYKFVITGSTNRKRDDLKNDIEKLGGKLVGAISKNINYLVTNSTDTTSSKYQKAIKLGIDIINEDKLLDLMK